MIQHEDSDEDDYEGYFLLPVKGYVLSEKIIEANKELFDEENSTAINLDSRQNSVSGGSSNESQKRVTFRPELEDYEPELSTTEDEEDDDGQEVEENDDNYLDISKNSEPILENIKETDFKEELNGFYSENMIENSNILSSEKLPEIDEICEEIECVNIEKEVDAESLKDSHHVTVEKEVSEDSEIVNSIEEPAHLEETTENSTNILPIDHVILTKETDESNTIVQKDVEPDHNSNLSDPSQKKHKSNHHNHHHDHSSATHSNNKSSNFLKIQLNFKPCCEYKYLENDRLPRYCGYVSQYGLSKEQLEMREKRRERYHRRKCERSSRTMEEESKKSQINEEAFARWLQNKMKTSRNMSKNMYDYKQQATKQQQPAKKVKKKD